MMKLTMFIQEKFGSVSLFRNLVMILFIILLAVMASGCARTLSPQESYNRHVQNQAENYRSWSGVASSKDPEQNRREAQAYSRWEKRAKCRNNYTVACWLMGY